MRIVVSGGGTGGHLFPALAIAKELEVSITDLQVTFVGTVKGIESKIIPKEGYELRYVRSEGLVGKGFLGTVKSLLKIPLSLKDSYKILRDIRPDLVIGVGGYSSGPVLLVAKLSGIPTMIHEQNTVPGLANRMLGKFVDTIAVSYQESIKSFPPERTWLTGNPVRKEILSGDREKGYDRFSLDKDRFTVFIFGGSSGAATINRAAGEALEFLEPYKDKIQFLHQTGNRDFDSVKNKYHTEGFKGTVIPFAYEMADAYAVADLVVARAGATTLAELTACGKASILVPYPYAAGNHQEVNARKLLDIGAARMILDSELDGELLSGMIINLMNEPDEVREIERTSRSLGSPDAAAKVVELMIVLLKKKSNLMAKINKGIKAESETDVLV